MKLLDSILKEKIKLEKTQLNIYLCGPTVYDDAHLGHARSSVCFDLLRRTGLNLLEITQILMIKFLKKCKKVARI